jgi:hypothetical protein
VSVPQTHGSGALPDSAAAVVRSRCVREENIEVRTAGSRVTFRPRYRTEAKKSRSLFNFACDQGERLLEACVRFRRTNAMLCT